MTADRDDRRHALRASSSSASSPTSPIERGVPGATIIGVAFEAPTAAFAVDGANELVNLVLQENVRLRTDRAGDTVDLLPGRGRPARRRDRAPVRAHRRDEDRERRRAARQPRPRAAPSSSVEQERLLALEREEAALRNQRATVVWVFERTGRSAAVGAQPRGGGARGAGEPAAPAAGDLRADEPADPAARDPDRGARGPGRRAARRARRRRTPTATPRRRRPSSTSSSPRSTPGSTSSPRRRR